MPTIIPIYAAVFGLLMIALAVRVIRLRRREKIALGSGSRDNLERAIRAHGNFAEYVPFALLLLAFVEAAPSPAWIVHGLCMILIAGRLLHATGLSRSPENFTFRTAGMASTFIVLATASTILLTGGSLLAGIVGSAL